MAASVTDWAPKNKHENTRIIFSKSNPNRCFSTKKPPSTNAADIANTIIELIKPIIKPFILANFTEALLNFRAYYSKGIKSVKFLVYLKDESILLE